MTRHADLQDTPELGVVARGRLADRGPAGAQPRHDRRLARARRSGVGHARRCCSRSTARSPRADRTATARSPRRTCSRTTSPPRSRHDEVITEVRLPALEGYGFGYQKFTRRAEDWSMVGVCALVSRAADGTCDDVRIGLTNMGATPLRATAAEDALRGGQLDDGSIAAAAEQAAEGTDPPGDLNATPDYKRHLARVLTRRALRRLSASELRQLPKPSRRLWRASATSPTAASPRPSTSRRRWSSRCCSRARPAWARPRWRRRSPG